MSDPAKKKSEPISDVFAILVDQCLAAPAAEHQRLVDQFCREHRDDADEIRARLKALRALGIDLQAPAPHNEFPEQLGDFRLLRELGSGGMGVVYLARQESLGREVALKLMRPEQLFFPQIRERFRREMETIARLQHPGIVPIFTVGEEDGLPYFAMERIRGTTLSEILASFQGKAPEGVRVEDCRAIVCQAAEVGDLDTSAKELYRGGWVQFCLRVTRSVGEALHHAHTRGVVHRDVKPSNVALTIDGRTLLLDFGLTSSGNHQRLTRTGSQLGTLPYMSPEQLDARHVGPRSDVYSLGVMLYEMLTLQLPFESDSIPETQKLIREGEPESIRARNRTVPVDVQTVCLAAMDRDPRRRFASAADFIQDLDNILERRPIVSRPPGTRVKIQRWIQRHPAISVAMGLGLLVLTLVPTILLLQNTKHNRELRAKNKELETSLSVQKYNLETATELFEFLAYVMQSADPWRSTSKDPTIREALDEAARRLELDLNQRPLAKATLLGVMARSYAGLGSFDKAIEMAESALSVYEKAEPDERIDLEWQTEGRSFSYAGLQLTLANVLIDSSDTDQLDRARGLARGVLAQVGDQGWELTRAAGHSMLGSIALRLGEYAEAEDELVRSLDLYEDHVGTDEFRYSVALNNLALLMQRTDRIEEAEKLYRRGLEACAMTPGPHPGRSYILNNYALLCVDEGRMDEGLEKYSEALENYRRVLPAQHHEIGRCVYNIARLWDRSGKMEKAMPYYEEAYDNLRTSPETDPVRLLNNVNYASALQRDGMFHDALDILDETIPGMERLWPDGHKTFVQTLQIQAQCFEDLGWKDDAHEGRRRAMQMAHDLNGTDGVPFPP